MRYSVYVNLQYVIVEKLPSTAKRICVLLFLLFCVLPLSIRFSSKVLAQDEPAQKIVRVGTYENYPKIYTDENGKTAGIFADIVNYIAEKESWEIEYIHGTWTECLDRLKNGEIDVMVDVAYSDERALEYDFSDETVFINWGVVYSRTDANIQSIPDLDKMKVVVMEESIHTTGEDGIVRLTEKFELNTTFVYVEDYTKVLEMLDLREADAGVVNRVFGDTFAKEYDVRQTPIVINPVKLKFAFPKGAVQNAYLQEKIDKHVFELTKDPYSLYYKSLNQYFQRDENIKLIERIPVWILGVLFGTTTLLITFFLISAELNRRVKKRTKTLHLVNEELREKIAALKESETTLKSTQHNLKEKIKEFEHLFKLTVGREKELRAIKEKIQATKIDNH